MITLEHITKKYGSAYALNDVSFSAPKGQVVGLLGQNGAGKTTTLNILTGYLPPTSGKASVGGFDLLWEPRQAKRLIGYLPEKPPLYDEMTVNAYLQFVCRLKEVASKGMRQHIEQILSITGLTEVQNRLLGHLSKGYRQRAGIAQALCGAPEVLVLDEPTVGLDPRQVVEIRSLIRSLGKNHTVIFSSHMLPEIQQLCQRVVILHQGRLIREADMKDLCSSGQKRLRLTAATGETQILPALRGLEGVTRVETLPGSAPGQTSVLLVCREGEPVEKRLFTLLSGLNAPIMQLTPVQNSLEEVFLQTTSMDA